MLSPTLECWNDAFLVNTVEMPTTATLMVSPTYLAAQIEVLTMLENVLLSRSAVSSVCTGLERL